MIRTLALLILFAPYALGQSGYLQGCRLTSDKNESKYVSFEHEQKEWQKYLCKTNYPKKPIDLKGFEFIGPRFTPFNNFQKTINEKNVISSAPNSFLFQSERLLGYINSGEVLCFDYSKSTKGFGYDFYIKQHEVTNEEYREFIQFTLDSNFLQLIANTEPDRFYNISNPKILNWPKSFKYYKEHDKYHELWESFFLDSTDHYLIHEKQKIDTRKLNYRYKDRKTGDEIVINIYPDTLKWVKDFNYSWNEPMTQMYNWHPVYNKYPVVGVSFNQIQAFLDWKMKQGVKKLEKAGILYEIGLPKPEEIEYTVCVTQANSIINYHDNIDYNPFDEYRDKNVLFNLSLANNPKFNYYKPSDAKSIQNKKNRLISSQLNPYSILSPILIKDGALHTLPVAYKIEKYPGLHSITNKIFHLGTNVSEWLDSKYSNYEEFINLKSKTLSYSLYPTITELGKELKERSAQFKPDYRLVMGSNWMDGEPNINYGLPLKAIYSKTFSHPDSSYSTLGFRYVIRILSHLDKPKPIKTKFAIWEVETGDTIGYKTIPKNETLKIKKFSILDSLSKFGFELKTDTSNKDIHLIEELEFYNKKIEERIHNLYSEIITSSYALNKSKFNQSKRLLILHYPKLMKAIDGFRTWDSILTFLPSSKENILIEYELFFKNEFTLILKLKN